jgi:hypothetical protein
MMDNYFSVFFEVNHIDDSTKRGDDIDVDASEINDGVTRLDQYCFGMT